MALQMILVILCTCIISVQSVWVKEMENEGAFEGDIILDPDERRTINDTHSYASIKGGIWEDVIPYEIEDSIPSGYHIYIKEAIQEYEDYTCLRFRETNPWDRAYLQFYSGSGCNSPLGYRRGRVNRISLGGGCLSKGIIMHEIGHSLGLIHEQNRPDRDEYVKINFKNIQMGYEYNFVERVPAVTDYFNTPYDYESMMHYGTYAFARSFEERVIETVDPSKQMLIGQRDGFSENDVININRRYQCKDVAMTMPPKVCVDKLPNCWQYVRRGDCTGDRTSGYMHRHCCRSCEDPTCYDVNEHCKQYSEELGCDGDYADYMKRNCCRTCKDKAAAE